MVICCSLQPTFFFSPRSSTRTDMFKANRVNRACASHGWSLGVKTQVEALSLLDSFDLSQPFATFRCTKAAEWSCGRTPACCTEGHGFKPQVGSLRTFNIGFHQQKLSSLSIACDIKLEGALYSVFYAEASKRPWTSLNE